MPSVNCFYLHILNFIHIIVSVYDVPEIRDADRDRQDKNECSHACAIACLWKSKDKFWESVLEMMEVRLSGHDKQFYILGHPARPPN